MIDRGRAIRTSRPQIVQNRDTAADTLEQGAASIDRRDFPESPWLLERALALLPGAHFLLLAPYNVGTFAETR